MERNTILIKWPCIPPFAPAAWPYNVPEGFRAGKTEFDRSWFHSTSWYSFFRLSFVLFLLLFLFSLCFLRKSQYLCESLSIFSSFNIPHQDWATFNQRKLTESPTQIRICYFFYPPQTTSVYYWRRARIQTLTPVWRSISSQCQPLRDM